MHHRDRPHRRLHAAAAVALALGLGALGLAAPGVARVSPAQAQSSIGFEVPSVADPVHTFGEPDIGVDVAGGNHVFVSGPTGTGTQRSVWLASRDGGHSYRAISPALPQALQTLTNSTSPPGGGDTEIAFDHTGKQYFADLYALLCLRVATTDGNGANPQQNVFPGGCAGLPGADRQWMAVYDPPAGTAHAYTGQLPLVYLEYNNLQTVQTAPATWNKSTDGTTYSAANNQTVGNFGADGYPAIDQQSGRVFQAALNGGDTGTAMLLNIGTIQADGSLKFLDDAAPGDVSATTKLIKVAGVQSDIQEAEFPVASMDAARNLYVAWVQKCCKSGDFTRHQTFLAVAPASSGWTRWTVTQVSSSPSQLSVFPWVKAGSAGRADVVWYGSNKAVDPKTNAGQAWDVYLNQVVFPTDAGGAVTGAAPTMSQVKATPHPMHYGSVCLIGTDCITIQGNRNLADFFEVTADATGAAEIVYDDTSNGLAQAGFTPGNVQLVDHAGAPVVSVLRQSSGPGIYGSDVSGPSNAPVTGISQPPGSALFPVIGGSNVPGMDILGSSMAESGGTLTVTTRVVDLSNPGATAQALNVPFTQFVTRWQMGNTIYYAAAENSAAGQTTYAAGPALSTDLCSVSACFPHVIDYPQAPVGMAQTGSIACPAAPTAASPCTLTIQVKLADVGSPTPSSLLEEVGAYAFAAAVPSTALVPPGAGNALALADSVPLQVDGLCCYDFQPPAAAAATTTTTTTSTSAGGAAAAGATPNTTGARPGSLAALLTLAGLPLLARWGRARARRGRARRPG